MQTPRAKTERTDNADSQWWEEGGTSLTDALLAERRLDLEREARKLRDRLDLCPPETVP